MANPRFVHQEAVRCVDCDIRGDLHDAGYPLKEAGGRIKACVECGGEGHVPAPSPVDPYALDVDGDAYARRRRGRAELRAMARLGRGVRHRYFDLVRIESLMSEEPHNA